MPKERNKKVIKLMNGELVGKIMTKFLGLRAKTYSYLIDDGSEGKKAKDTNKYVINRKIKFENYKNCLEVTQCENKINHLEKKIDIDNIKENHKKFVKNNKSILKLPLKKLTRLFKVQTMIKECNQLIQ